VGPLPCYGYMRRNCANIAGVNVTLHDGMAIAGVSTTEHGTMPIAGVGATVRGAMPIAWWPNLSNHEE